MKMHELKTIQPYFDDIWNGKKKFEIRKDDRGFEVGDLLWIREYSEYCYVGRSILARIDYKVYCIGLVDGYCALGIHIMDLRND